MSKVIPITMDTNLEPEISVLMPVYNCEKFIGAAIQSILQQTFKNYELLVIDDGSSDNTEHIVSTFSDRRIKYIKRDRKGLVPQLNYGLSIARAGLIARMDADDIAMEDRLQKQYTFLNKNSHIGVVGTGYIEIDGKNKKIRERYFPENNYDIKKSLPVLVAISHGTVLYRKDIIVKAGRYTHDSFPVEDLDLWLRLVNMTEFANIPELLLKRRINPYSVTIINNAEVRQKMVSIGTQYLLQHLSNEKNELMCIESRIQLARLEYYFGSMQIARKRLYTLIKIYPFNFQLWRYFLPSLIPHNIIWWLRNKGILSMFNKIYHHKKTKSKYAL